MICRLCIDLPVDTAELPVPGRQGHMAIIEECLCPPVMRET